MICTLIRKVVPETYLKKGKFNLTTGFIMKKLSKNLLATLSGLMLIVFPQLTFAEGEEDACN